MPTFDATGYRGEIDVGSINGRSDGSLVDAIDSHVKEGDYLFDV